MFEECRKVCDYLIVGIQTDPTIDRPGKSKPIQSIVERQMQVRACKYVDNTIVYETEEDLEDLLATLDINIRFVGMDHRGGFMTGEEICKKRNIEIVYTSRDHDFSSTDLRERIKKACS